MAEPITPERLAALRERYERGDDDTIELLLELIAVGMDPFAKPKPRNNWIELLKAYQADHVALLAEVERLTAEPAVLAEALDPRSPHFSAAAWAADLFDDPPPHIPPINDQEIIRLLMIQDRQAQAEAFRAIDPYLSIAHAVLGDGRMPPVAEFRLARATAEMLCARWLNYKPGSRPPTVPFALMGVPVIIDDDVPLDALRVRRPPDGDTDVQIPVAFTD